MSLIAFDLDNTLGFFFHVGIWSDFFSVDTIENSFNREINPGLRLSTRLKVKLREAEALYIKKILASPRILKTVLRPNLDEMIRPLIKHKKDIRAVVIYSNTWNSFTPHIGKALIESIYKCPGLFDCVVDAAHPIRRHDWKRVEDGQPLKTFKVLKEIFSSLCHVKGSIEPEDILFVDEREEKHDLEKEPGLTYLKPTVFDPKLTSPERREIYKMGLDVLEETDLLDDEEYLGSPVFFCRKYSSTKKTVQVKGIEQLLKMVGKRLLSEGLTGVRFKDDSKELRECMRDFLK
jgi:hypothetical protein